MLISNADTLRAAIIGCGNIAGGYDRASAPDVVQTHVKAYVRHPRMRMAAVSDVRPEQAQAFAREWNVPHAYADAAELLRVEQPDMVSLCVPDETHAAMIRLCLQAPRPPRAIWCEKPIDVSVEAAREAIEACERAGVLLAVNYMRRCDPQVQRIGARLRAGELGQPRKAIFTYSNGLRHAGSHGLNLLLDWLGRVTTSEVSSMLQDRADDDVTLDARLRMTSGADVLLVGLDERRYSQWEIDLFTDEARVRIAHFGGEVRWQSARPLSGWPAIRELGPEQVTLTDLPRIMSLVLDDIVAALGEGRPPICDGGSALETLRLCNELIAKVR